MPDVRTTTLPDAQTAPEAPPSPTHTTIRREDYWPPDWLVPEIALRFTLGVEKTRVQSKLSVERNPDAQNESKTLRLNGDELTPAGVWIDGELSNTWRMDGGDLLIELPGERHEIGIENEISPSANTKLMGLYASNGMLCTQCEAQGFRRITFFPDRPDVLSKYRVRMEGDATAFPVLLSNGNQVGHGEAANGRHWAEWEDPFPKPCYLFALVAGNLKANRDSFTTMSGRKVDLAIWVREADLPKTQHAMNSLKLAMAWDEKVYGREYDLDQFNIVAVSDFNMGAMENKSLNIFNSAYVLADQETATDADFDNIARVVAHE
jgi:aminopeptidase N